MKCSNCYSYAINLDPEGKLCDICFLRRRIEELTKTEQCTWKEDEEGIWNTNCGCSFILNEGYPSENNMKYCCYCSKLLVEKRYTEVEGR